MHSDIYTLRSCLACIVLEGIEADFDLLGVLSLPPPSLNTMQTKQGLKGNSNFRARTYLVRHPCLSHIQQQKHDVNPMFLHQPQDKKL